MINPHNNLAKLGESCADASNCESGCCFFNVCDATPVCGGPGPVIIHNGSTLAKLGDSCSSNANCESDCCYKGTCR